VILTPSERRRAERFDALVDGRAEARDEDAGPLALAARVRSAAPDGDVDPAFRDQLRARLLAVAAVQGIGAGAAGAGATASAGAASSAGVASSRPHDGRQRRFPRRLALAAGTLAALVALSGVGMASDGAVPGDALYGVKRSRETAQLALARSAVSRGQLHLQFAQARIAEAATVAGHERELRRVLDDMDAATRAGMRELSGAALARADRAPLDLVDEFVVRQRRDLIALIARLTGSRRTRVVSSLGLLERVRERSTALRPTLLCTIGYPNANQTDELGPLPHRCAAMPGVEPGGTSVPGGPSTTPAPRSSGPATGPRRSTATGPVATAAPPDPGRPGQPDQPDGQGPSPGPSGQPSPSPSGGTQKLLGDVTDTVGDVVGGLVGPLAGH
jgi:hypothetical protein